MARWLEGIIEPELVPIASWIIIAFIALIAIFIAVVSAGILATGFLFNFLL
jgi:hypothetical protein